MKAIFFLALLGTAAWGCTGGSNGKEGDKEGSKAPAIVLPNTPEEVALTWQNAVNQNDYDLAELLSYGPSTKGYINTLREGTKLDAPDSSLVEDLVMRNLACHVEGNSAICDFEDEFGSNSLHLTKEDGQWKVVLPEDEKDFLQ